MREHDQYIIDNFSVMWSDDKCKDPLCQTLANNLNEFYKQSIQAYGIDVGNNSKYNLVIPSNIFIHDISDFIKQTSEYICNKKFPIEHLYSLPNSFRKLYTQFDNNSLNDILQVANTQVVFVGNTERVMFDSIQTPIKKLVVSSGALNPIMYAWWLGFDETCEIDIVDISNVSLVCAKRWIEEFDGINAKRFATKLKTELEVDGKTILTRGYAHVDRMQNLVNDEVKKGFYDWKMHVLPKIKVNYKFHDFFNYKDNKQLVDSIDRPTYVHLSNIFHYQPTAMFYNQEYRVKCFKTLIDQLSLKDVYITAIDPLHCVKPSVKTAKEYKYTYENS